MGGFSPVSVMMGFERLALAVLVVRQWKKVVRMRREERCKYQQLVLVDAEGSDLVVVKEADEMMLEQKFRLEDMSEVEVLSP